MPTAVVLLSGGLDSYTAAAIAQREGFRAVRADVSYGQRHAREIEAARAVARALGVARHIELDVDLAAFGGSSLTTDAPVPKDRPLDADRHSRRPTCRRATRCSCRWRSAWAEVLGARDIVIGVNALDYSGYPDCRPEYIEAFEQLAAAGDPRRCRGRAVPHPRAAAALTKAEIMRRPLTRPRLRPDPQLLRPGPTAGHAAIATAASCARKDMPRERWTTL